MKILLAILLVIIILIVFVLAIRMILIASKRPERKRELRHEIDMINDPAGCCDAEFRFLKCLHILEHYDIRLNDVNYPYELSRLWDDVRDSIQRSQERKAQTCSVTNQ